MNRSCKCGADLGDVPRYMTMCRSCFIAAKRQEEAALVAEVETLREQVRLLKNAARPKEKIITREVIVHEPIPPAMVRTLIQLCHPDRNENSAASKRATLYLLSLHNKGK